MAHALRNPDGSPRAPADTTIPPVRYTLRAADFTVEVSTRTLLPAAPRFSSWAARSQHSLSCARALSHALSSLCVDHGPCEQVYESPDVPAELASRCVSLWCELFGEDGRADWERVLAAGAGTILPAQLNGRTDSPAAAHYSPRSRVLQGTASIQTIATWST